ncbi:activating signal cointegrator 1 isoform X2 [Lagenorhynchus albirostris]|uniref:activating signal cointegrator 1 isoform X2 n=1 Tax=Lagenorhynchus albirostris TaxID=27610 RepID=UPI0028EC55C8|nr:activating signal cointegrator 1 isoform X2 [Lagenorhynchus albirostris]
MAVTGALSQEQLVGWCTQQLRKTFGLDVSEEIIQYVLSIESAEELREYVTDLLQGNEGRKGQFIEELVTKWQKNDQELISDALQQSFKKDEILDGQRSGDQLKRSRRKGRNRQEVPAFTEPDTTIEVKTPFDLAKVCTREEQDILQRDSNKSQKLLKKLMSGTENSGKVDISTKDLLRHQELRFKSGLEKAIKHKDKLLEFDRTSIRRTHVIDDESDYFASDSNQWLSKIEREALQKREEELREFRHASRLSKKITIDFAGRKIMEDENPLTEYHSKLDEAIHAIANGTLNQPPTKLDRSSEEPLGLLVNPNLYQSPPQWIDQTGAASQKKAFHSAGSGLEFSSCRHQFRIQDQEFQEGFDGGWCLSMHQPWASLLVRGIKRVEGRSWYTPHRGRLWIAATAKRPSPQEVSELQTTYLLLRGKDVEFPNDYPSGCLLGCVDLTDCLSQKQFKNQYPDMSQESDSPFVFICTNPQEMIVKFPIKGSPKIWKLDSKIHQGAKKGLMKQNKAV